ncbi:glycosyltransferase family 4 protein [Candidatus Gottesmanbacteria bacterium]|nr:glycosyltransferase family 4 protein [Candidatus Gottesmanbacteria bacterium]
MRIALLGSVSTSIPPSGQAAIEQLVYSQALGFAAKNHKVSLFAPGTSTIHHAHIDLVDIGVGETLLGVGKKIDEDTIRIGSSYKLRLEIAQLGNVLEELIKRQNDYDIVLNNLRGESIVLPVLHYIKKPVVHVMHLPLFDELVSQLEKYKTPLISISNAQRKAYPHLNYIATVYNGVDTGVFAYNDTPKNYFLYLGSIARNKNPVAAIRVAKKAGVPLKIGGRIKDQGYYQTEIAPHINGTDIQWVGEISKSEIVTLYQEARGFLFPTLWEEPFGLVLIEAMACGTPVVAFGNGAITEIVVDGKTGFVIEDNSEVRMVEAVKKINSIRREDCRKHIEENFTIEKMVNGYEKALEKVLKNYSYERRGSTKS